MIPTIINLYILANLDAMFSGICAASGREGQINKRRYYLNSMLVGAAWGQVACLLGLLILGVAATMSPDRQTAVQEMVAVGERMTTIYCMYALVIFLTFAVRAIPSVDIRSITSTVFFGPLTLLRPAVIVIGIGWGLALQPQVAVVIAAILIAVIMAPFRIFLNIYLDLRTTDPAVSTSSP